MQAKKKKILIISSQQFGYLTDTYKYCDYSRNDFDITYLGWDSKFSKVNISGINIKYIQRKKNPIFRKVTFLKALISEITEGNYNVIFINYFRGVFLLYYFLHKKRSILDIRTSSVHPNKFKRSFFDAVIKFESLFFKEVTIIDKEVANRLKIRKFNLLPLGGECFKNGNFNSNQVHFLYVGTLQNRKLIKVVKAFKLFLDDSSISENNSILTIVGDSPGNELNEIRRYVDEHNLCSKVKLIGRVPHDQLSIYFKNASIGISYIPIESAFDLQPPTKTYEYLISGLPVLATKTSANQGILNSNNFGVLIGDEINSIVKGLFSIYKLKDFYNPMIIKSQFKKYTWESIVHEYFIPIINSKS